ncbi:hypothetical protein PQX77_008754 [Marasmius sp. AFHP31]|nr:hypothetical protein PQX77_008754 [Marasmius sp. AFHP31]
MGHVASRNLNVCPLELNVPVPKPRCAAQENVPTVWDALRVHNLWDYAKSDIHLLLLPLSPTDGGPRKRTSRKNDDHESYERPPVSPWMFGYAPQLAGELLVDRSTSWVI